MFWGPIFNFYCIMGSKNAYNTERFRIVEVYVMILELVKCFAYVLLQVSLLY
jgi:hypothetical protein